MAEYHISFHFCRSRLKEWKAKIAVSTGSPKLDSWRQINATWSDEAQFLLRLIESVFRIWHQELESMNSTCLVSTLQAGGGGVMVWGMCSWYDLGFLIPIKHRLNAAVYVSTVHPFLATIYLSPPFINLLMAMSSTTPYHRGEVVSLTLWFHLSHLFL